MIDEQLRLYREEQRRRHDQLANESVHQPHSSTNEHHPSRDFVRPAFIPTHAAPSAPPEEVHHSENVFDTNRPLYPDIEDEAKKVLFLE